MIVFVNNFELKSPAEDFERAFNETSDYVCTQPGFISHRLVRSVADPSQYLNIALWESEGALRTAAGRPGFQEHARRLREHAATSPRFFVPVIERRAGSARLREPLG